jgi:hypothetical protein
VGWCGKIDRKEENLQDSPRSLKIPIWGINGVKRGNFMGVVEE